MARRSSDHAAHSGVGLVGAPRWHLQSRDFVFDQERNVYVCPGGAALTSTGNIDQGHTPIQGQQERLLGLRLKATVHHGRRKVTRDLNEDVRESVRALANTDAFQQAMRHALVR